MNDMADQQTAIAYIVAANPQQKGHQRAAIGWYADAHGLELAGEYLDEGDSRRGLGGTLMAIRDGMAKIVLVAKAEHLAETMVERQVIIALQAHRGAQVIECATGERLSEGESIEARLIHEAVAITEDLRRQTTVGRLVEASRTGAKRGRKPYGTYPHEKPVVDLVMSLRREKRWGVRRIANELNRRGIVNRAGGKWIPPAIQRIFNRHE